MIERPKKAVTRFFVPLIDVLILLFCIFLLMPFMDKPAESADPSKDPAQKQTPEEMRKEIMKLRIELERTEKDVKRFKDERVHPSENLSVCVLEIDPKNGWLYAFRGTERARIKSEREALDVIDEHKRRTPVGKEPLFLILAPREISTEFKRKTKDEYISWFKDAPFQFDDPFAPIQ